MTTHAPGSWYLAPATDRSDEHSAGYEGNSFDSQDEAIDAIDGLRQIGEDFAAVRWVAVQRRIAIGTTFLATNGSTYAGVTVGNGFDAEILVVGHARNGDILALVCITHVESQSEWMLADRFPADADLEREAVAMAQNPPFDEPELAADDSEEWEPLAQRWDAVVAEVRS